MRCPQDAGLLSLEIVYGHSGYLCSGCKGVWLPRKFVESIKYSHEFSPEAFYAGLGDVRRSSDLRCPAGCGTLRAGSLLTEGVYLCTVCLGVWFERGGVRSLLAKFEQGNPKVEAAVDVVSFVALVVELFT
jgi:Zn-finger nucleic acid-binding protein